MVWAQAVPAGGDVPYAFRDDATSAAASVLAREGPDLRDSSADGAGTASNGGGRKDDAARLRGQRLGRLGFGAGTGVQEFQVAARDDERLHLRIGEVLANLGGILFVVREIEQVIEDLQRRGELMKHMGGVAAELGHGFDGVGLEQVQILGQRRLSEAEVQGQGTCGAARLGE